MLDLLGPCLSLHTYVAPVQKSSCININYSYKVSVDKSYKHCITKLAFISDKFPMLVSHLFINFSPYLWISLHVGQHRNRGADIYCLQGMLGKWYLALHHCRSYLDHHHIVNATMDSISAFDFHYVLQVLWLPPCLSVWCAKCCLYASSPFPLDYHHIPHTLVLFCALYTYLLAHYFYHDDLVSLTGCLSIRLTWFFQVQTSYFGV